MQDRGLQVVDVDRILDDVEAQVVGSAVGHPGLDAAAGHPHGEGLRMVIAAQAASQRRVASRPSACVRTRRPR